MEISSIDPNCLPEILGAIALAHACEFLEMYSDVGRVDWRYYFSEQAVESLRELSENQIEKLIDEKFIEHIPEMKITKVYFSALFNTGNYSNERIAMSALLEEGETPEDAVAKLKEKVIAIAGPEPQKVYKALQQRERDLAALNEKVEKARREWEILSDFLRAQGIKPDVAAMPLFDKLLPLSRDPEVVYGEIDDEDITRTDDDEDDD